MAIRAQESDTTAEPTVLVRFSGEISIKARGTRERFCERLAANIEDALEANGIAGVVERRWSRILVATDDPDAADAAETVARVAGVQSASPIERRRWSSLDDLVAAGQELMAPRVRGRRFAVRARRGNRRERIPFRSPDVERALGTALLAESAGVDLDDPEVTVGVEVHPGTVDFYHRVVDGPGGLPVGVEGRALALVSGGFDSAVAAWLMLKRGVALDFAFFDLGGRPHELGALRVMRLLAERWCYGDRPRLWSVDFGPVLADLKENVTPRYWQVVLKRLMLSAGDAMARRLRRPALVTGESLGQVSSQTLDNLALIDAASGRPVLRPLVGWNKEEIVGLAHRIGTFDASARVEEYCDLHARRPTTAAKESKLAQQEARLDPDLVARAVDAARCYDLRGLDPAQLAAGELARSEIPDGAVVVDLRPRAAHRAWHPAGALHLPYQQALQAWRAFDRGQRYLLACEVGLKSAHLAELMRAAGFEAWNLEGGLERWRKRRRPAAARG